MKLKFTNWKIAAVGSQSATTRQLGELSAANTAASIANHKIVDKLREVNGKIARPMTLADIKSAVEAAEWEFEKLGVAKKRRVGARVVLNTGECTPKAYKYHHQAIVVVLQRWSSHWYLIEAYRVSVYPKTNVRSWEVAYTPAQAEEIIQKFKDKLTIQKDIVINTSENDK